MLTDDLHVLVIFLLRSLKMSAIISQTWTSRAEMELGWQSAGLANTGSKFDLLVPHKES